MGNNSFLKMIPRLASIDEWITLLTNSHSARSSSLKKVYWKWSKFFSVTIARCLVDLGVIAHLTLFSRFFMLPRARRPASFKNTFSQDRFDLLQVQLVIKRLPRKCIGCLYQLNKIESGSSLDNCLICLRTSFFVIIPNKRL